MLITLSVLQTVVGYFSGASTFFSLGGENRLGLVFFWSLNSLKAFLKVYLWQKLLLDQVLVWYWWRTKKFIAGATTLREPVVTAERLNLSCSQTPNRLAIKVTYRKSHPEYPILALSPLRINSFCGVWTSNVNSATHRNWKNHTFQSYLEVCLISYPVDWTFLRWLKSAYKTLWLRDSNTFRLSAQAT